AADAIARPVVAVVALAPIVRRGRGVVVHAPTRLHVFDRAIVLVRRPAQEEAEFSVGPEAAAIRETALIGVAACDVDLPVLSGHVSARRAFRCFGDEV